MYPWESCTRHFTDLAGKAGDSETEDMMVARLQVHEKTVWTLKGYSD